MIIFLSLLLFSLVYTMPCQHGRLVIIVLLSDCVVKSPKASKEYIQDPTSQIC